MNKILAAWAWNGPVSEPIAYGEGHINQTYALTEQATQKRYILQKINTDTFKDPDGLMENICGVTDFLREKAKQRGADPERATLHVALTKAGKPYYKAADGGCWRVYDFVENTVCLQQVQSAEDFYQSAVAFGNFQHQLADYPANTLHETIPHFHDTPKRFADFQRAVAEDRMGRAAQVQREIEFVRAREADYHVMVDLLTAGKLPLRVTHNDTKLNNILFDKTTGEGLCVIDLDTVMPGLAAQFTAYLATVLKNRRLTYIRHLKKIQKVECSYEYAAETIEHVDSIREESLESAVEAKLMWEAIKPYLHKLSPKECEVMICLYIDRLSIADTATKLKIKPDTVSTHKHNAINKIRKAMGEH